MRALRVGELQAPLAEQEQATADLRGIPDLTGLVRVDARNQAGPARVGDVDDTDTALCDDDQLPVVEMQRPGAEATPEPQLGLDAPFAKQGSRRDEERRHRR